MREGSATENGVSTNPDRVAAFLSYFKRNDQNRFHFPRLTIAHLWVVVCIALVVSSVSSVPIQPADFWQYLEAGRYMVHERTLLDYDRYSFTITGQPFINLHWGSEVLFYLIYALGGIPLLVAVQAVIIGCTFLLILATMYRRTSNIRLAVISTLVCFVIASPALGLRPQVFSVLCFAATFALLERRILWPLPVIFIMWANLHAAFPLGLMLVGFYALANPSPARYQGERTVSSGTPAWRRLIDFPMLAVLLTCTAATLVTPWGVRIYPAIVNAQTVSRASLISEWAPVNVQSVLGACFFIMAFGLALTRSFFGPRWRFRELMIFLTFTYLVLRQERAVVWWVIATLPLIVDTLVAALEYRRSARSPSRPQQKGRDLAAINWIFTILLFGHVVLSSPWLKSGYALLPPNKRILISPATPVAMVRILSETADVSRVFAEMTWGGYISWALHGRLQTFYDARVVIYPKSVIDSYLSVIHVCSGWERILDGAQVDALVLSKEFQPQLVAAARSSPLWRPVYEDRYGIGLVRVTAIPRLTARGM
jgi:hypothetical protein